MRFYASDANNLKLPLVDNFSITIYISATARFREHKQNKILNLENKRAITSTNAGRNVYIINSTKIYFTLWTWGNNLI